MMREYNLVAVGGTFDHFHKGHKSLLNKAFFVSQKVIIGITSDRFVRNKAFAFQILPYEKRIESVLAFLDTQGYKRDRVTIFKLTNMFGPLLDNNAIEALVIGPKTIKGAQYVNRERKKLGFSALPIIEAEAIKGTDNKYLSSTRVREGVITRDGVLYSSLFTADITIKKSFRNYLQKSHGKILKDAEEFRAYVKDILPGQRIWVGDSVGKTFIQTRCKFKLGVFDSVVRREEDDFFSSYLLENDTIETVTNDSGKITIALVKKIKRVLQQDICYLKVKGEEDLAAVPLLLLLPLGAVLFYGLRDVGIIAITVTEDKKRELYQRLQQ